MVVKKMIGDEIFTSEWEAARKQITSRRSERKRKLDQQAIIDPEAFNRKNIKKHEKERKRKKKLLEERKMVAPGTQSKKQKFNSVEKMWFWQSYSKKYKIHDFSLCVNTSIFRYKMNSSDENNPEPYIPEP